MTKLHRLILGTAIALLLTGCASPGKPAPTETPQAAQSGHSVQQWASSIAKQKVMLDKWEANWAADSCSADGTPALPCGMDLLGGTMNADTIKIYLGMMTLPNDLGKPPAEISSLFAETVAASDKASTTGKAWVATCNAQTTDQCASLAFQFTTAMDELSTEFTGWSPYL